MSNTEYFLIMSLIANAMMAYIVLIALTLYLHARQWRDEWRDAHVDMLNQMRDALREE